MRFIDCPYDILWLKHKKLQHIVGASIARPISGYPLFVGNLEIPHYNFCLLILLSNVGAGFASPNNEVYDFFRDGEPVPYSKLALFIILKLMTLVSVPSRPVSDFILKNQKKIFSGSFFVFNEYT